jgi:hypothetical protein
MEHPDTSVQNSAAIRVHIDTALEPASGKRVKLAALVHARHVVQQDLNHFHRINLWKFFANPGFDSTL